LSRIFSCPAVSRLCRRGRQRRHGALRLRFPPPGDWVGSLSGYGDVAYFLISAQANRTLSVAVTALDETGAPSEAKAAPVVGMWTLGDPEGTAPPVLSAAPFNSEAFGMSSLDAQVLSTNSFIIGIADLRGDGRPDYTYHAHVLYGDSVSPSRAPVSGGAITLQGTGFAPRLAVRIRPPKMRRKCRRHVRSPQSISSSTDPPNRSPSCTKAANSAASAPSGLRPGNKASSTARLPSAAS
jgi:hypothetical protein